jgi:hypothetical protein
MHSLLMHSLLLHSQESVLSRVRTRPQVSALSWMVSATQTCVSLDVHVPSVSCYERSQLPCMFDVALLL